MTIEYKINKFKKMIVNKPLPSTCLDLYNPEPLLMVNCKTGDTILEIYSGIDGLAPFTCDGFSIFFTSESLFTAVSTVLGLLIPSSI
jgi:hypothetical protein